MTQNNLAHASGLPNKVWLASRSPRRLELLTNLGVVVEVFIAKPSAQAEALEAPLADELPVDYVQRVTLLKLDAALEAMRLQGLTGVVLASDTTVAIGNQILGKPADVQEAHSMLQSLSNTTHQVHTGVAVALLSEKGEVKGSFSALHTAQVEFSQLPVDFIKAYIASGEPFDKAGGYGIQGTIAQYIPRISGSHSGIMGLPLFETANLLRAVNNLGT